MSSIIAYGLSKLCSNGSATLLGRLYSIFAHSPEVPSYPDLVQLYCYLAIIMSLHNQAYFPQITLLTTKFLSTQIIHQLKSSHINILMSKKSNWRDSWWNVLIDFHLSYASSFSSLVLPIKNKDGTYHVLIIDELLNKLHGSTIFTKSQIRLVNPDIYINAFSIHRGYFEFLVIPFGPICTSLVSISYESYLLRNHKFIMVFFMTFLYIVPPLLTLETLRDNLVLVSVLFIVCESL